MEKQASQNNFFSQQAKKEGYPARSVYKLKELDEKFNLFKKGFFVLDLGAAPGSWTLFISSKIEAKGKVVALDCSDLKITLPLNAVFVKKDILKDGAIEELRKYGKFDCLVSDLAPKLSGVSEIDQENSFLIWQRILEICHIVLKERGCLVMKILQSPQSQEFVKDLKKYFFSVKALKPKASLGKSREFFVVGQKYAKKQF